MGYGNKSITDWVDECGRIAKEKGWDEKPVDFGMTLMLIVSECSEALEEYRNDMVVGTRYHYHGDDRFDDRYCVVDHSTLPKPEGITSEMADIVIRVMHYCSLHQIDLEDAIRQKLAYNETRDYRHGGKKT